MKGTKKEKKRQRKKKSATEPMAKWESMVLFVFKTLKCTFNHDAQAHFDWNSFEVATNTLRRVCFVFDSTASCVESADGFLLWRLILNEKKDFQTIHILKTRKISAFFGSTEFWI